jgi:hypothetical protein
MREIKSASERNYGIVISQMIGEMPVYLDCSRNVSLMLLRRRTPGRPTQPKNV